MGAPIADSPWLTRPALRSALDRVWENRGCAGSDGVTLHAFCQHPESRLNLLFDEVASGHYRPWPLRRILAYKDPERTRTRNLLVPAVRDRILQTAVAAFWEPIMESEFEDCSFGYRRGRGVRMAIDRVAGFLYLGYRWVLDADIDSFFDSLDWDIALSRLTPLIPDELSIRLARLWLESPVWDGLNLSPRQRGLPQGAVISPMIANLCLDTLDERLEAGGYKVVRYADDFVVLAKSRPAAERARELTESVLASLRLRLKEEKTSILEGSEGLRFLGVLFFRDMLLRPYQSKPLQRGIASIAGPLPPDLHNSPLRRRLRDTRLPGL